MTQLNTRKIVSYVALALCGVVILIWGLRIIEKDKESYHWPSVAGTVIDSEVISSLRSKKIISKRIGLDKSYLYYPEITYEYFVDDIRYVSNKIAFIRMESSDPSYAQRIIKQYPKGIEVEVFYNPSNPQESILELGVNKVIYLSILLGIVCLFPTIVGLINYFVKFITTK